jgi:Predicted Zn-dependent peptidases
MSLLPNCPKPLGQSSSEGESPAQGQWLHAFPHTLPAPPRRCSLRRLPLALLLPSLALAEPAYQTRTLPNGLTVLVAEDPSSPLVTVEIGVRNGSMTEPPEYNGLSHLYEHMFFKANAVLPDQEAYLARARELGLVWNGTTNTERVNYFFTTARERLPEALVFMRDAIVSPLFDQKELERERVVVTGEIDRNESTPQYHFWHVVNQHVWWKYPSRKDPLGNRATVLGATVEKMRTIQARYYVPNNSILVVTGDAKAEDVFSRAESLFSGWKASAQDPLKAYPLVKHPPLKRSELVLVEQPVQTVSGQFVWHGPSTVGKELPATYAADVQGTAVNRPDSRFQRALVDSGHCVRAQMVWFTQINTGPSSVQFESTPERTRECVEAIQAELPKMAQPDYLTPDELRDAVHRLAVDRALEREKPSDLAHQLTFWWSSAGLDYYRTYLDRAAEVTPTDVSRYVRRYLLDRPYVLGLMVSPEMQKQGLDRTTLAKLVRPVRAPRRVTQEANR